MSDFAKDKDVPDKNVGDMIGRHEAIDAVRRLQTYKLSEGDDMLLVDKAEAQTELMMLPSAQPEQRWIPMTEKLPERGVSVLVSHVGYVSEDYLDIDDGAMYFWNSGIDLDEELNNLAWMSLPAPWKGEDDVSS